MKIFQNLMMAATFLVCSMAVAQEGKTVKKVTIQTAIKCDHCKQCETCGGLLERTLIKEKGIQMITLDEAARTIHVIYNSKKTNLETIRTAISNLGYDADDVKANPEAVALLDGCCKA